MTTATDYLSESISFGGEMMPRGEAIRIMQDEGHPQACIDRWLQGNDHTLAQQEQAKPRFKKQTINVFIEASLYEESEASEVEAYVCGQWAVHRRYSGSDWSVSHVATGYGFGRRVRFKRLANAKRFALMVDQIGIGDIGTEFGKPRSDWTAEESARLRRAVYALHAECEASA